MYGTFLTIVSQVCYPFPFFFRFNPMIARKFNHGDINKRTINQQIAFGRFILTVGRHVSVE